MNVLVLTNPDGSKEKFVGLEALEKMKKMPLSKMAPEAMLVGIPFIWKGGQYVIDTAA